MFFFACQNHPEVLKHVLQWCICIEPQILCFYIHWAKKLAEGGRPRIEVQRSRTLVCYKRGDEKRQLVRLILIGIVVGLKAVAQQLL